MVVTGAMFMVSVYRLRSRAGLHVCATAGVVSGSGECMAGLRLWLEWIVTCQTQWLRLRVCWLAGSRWIHWCVLHLGVSLGSL